MTLLSKLKHSANKGFKKAKKGVNKGFRHVENMPVNTVYQYDRLIEGENKANKHRRSMNQGIDTLKGYYNTASDYYDMGDSYIHNQVRSIPIIGRELDETLYLADNFANPLTGYKNIADTVSGKQSLSTGLMNEYAGEAVYAKNTYDRNTKKKKKKKRNKEKNSKTIEKDRKKEDIVNNIFF